MVQRKYLRRAVSAVIRRADGLVLAVRRPDEPGEELPGLWGLPATTLAEGESPEEGVRRLGREKLGVALTLLRAFAQGEQARPSGDGRKDYTLRMTLYEASLAGEPRLPDRASGASGTLYEALDWLPEASFQQAADGGSLCCRLLLGALTPGPSPASGRGEPEDHAERRAPGPRRPKIAPQLHERLTMSARALRQEPTRSEGLLWQELRNRRLQGRKFRRQQRIGVHIVDFYCAGASLVVEIDGSVHRERGEEDRARQDALEQLGLRVLRVKAEEVERNIAAVLIRIGRALGVEQ